MNEYQRGYARALLDAKEAIKAAAAEADPAATLEQRRHLAEVYCGIGIRLGMLMAEADHVLRGRKPDALQIHSLMVEKAKAAQEGGG